MNSNNYVENVLRTDTPLTMELQHRLSDPETIRLLHAAMGLATESGEFMDMLKKHIFYGRPLDLVNAREELGDTMWYVGLAVDVIRTTLNEVMTTNIKKLQLRYPEKFTEERALERNLEAERELLERLKQPADIEGLEHHGYEGVSDEEYRNMNNLRGPVMEAPTPENYSERGREWLEFAFDVAAHIENYTVPQYGDKGKDQMTDWSIEECLLAVKKRYSRYGRQSREGQQMLDFMKMAHEVQIAAFKFKEEESK